MFSVVPPDPLNATEATFTPDPSRDLFTGSGEQLVVDIHVTAGSLATHGSP
jgi:hypothetical protein